jgi:hypothetical protein
VSNLKDALLADMHDRLAKACHAGMTNQAYLEAAVGVMFEVVAEVIERAQNGGTDAHTRDAP